MKNLNRQNNSNYNQFYSPQNYQYLYNKSKDNIKNKQNNNIRAFSPNFSKKNNNQDYSYMNKQEMPLKNSNKQIIQLQRNPQTFQNYPYKQNISDKPNSQNYFSPIPKQIPENINLHNFNTETKKFYTFSNNNSKKSKKTLILDLDETLVHSGFHPFNRKSDYTLNIKVDGKNHTIYVLKRPYVEEFLAEIAPYYEIIIFTASISEYASPLLDLLDKNKLTSGRLFRQHCLFNHGLYLKDINIVQKDLKDVIIIDNNPVSYVMNQDNGLPILTWYDDLNDKELIKYIPLLKYLSTVDDIRETIKKIVDKQTNKIKFEIVDELIKNKINENNNYKDLIYQTNDNYNKNSMSNISNNNNIQKNKNETNTNSNYNKNYINSNYNEKKYEIKINNKFDIKKNYNINKDEENKIKNYFNNDNNFYKYNNYNNSIHDSLSNMTYNEIQNEGTINNEKENQKELNNYNDMNYNNNKSNYNKRGQNYVIQKAINYDNHKHYEERNKINAINKQNELLNKDNKINQRSEIGVKNNSNYEFQINNLYNNKVNNIEHNQNKRNYSSNTYNTNMRKVNYKYNSREQKYRGNNSIISKEIKNNNYELRYINNNEIGEDKIYNLPKPSNYIDENNKYLENITFETEKKNEDARDNYLKMYQQQLLKLRMNENNYPNNNLPNNNINVNNIHIYQNKNMKSQINQNMNYQNNNNINRNHSINSLNYRRNNMNFINFNNNIQNLNNINNMNQFYHQRFANDYHQNYLLKREEKIFKDEPKEFDENNIQKMNTNLRFFKTQTNFMQNYKDRNNNNIFNFHNLNQKNDFRFNKNFRRNNEEKEEKIVRPKINNYFNDNELNRSFSSKKGYITNKASNIDLDRKARERKKYDFLPYDPNRKESNEDNIKNINLNNDINSINYRNQRNDTDVYKENRNDNFSLNAQEDKNNNLDYRDKIFNYQRENNIQITNYKNKINNFKDEYLNKNNNENNSKYSQKLSKTDERKFYRSSSTKPYNNKYLYNNDNSRIPRNYNNININNYNFYNSFIDNNKEKPEENRLYNNNLRMQYYANKDEEQNSLNRSSSYFHPRPSYYSLFNQNGNAYTPNAIKRNNLLKSKFLNNFGNYRFSMERQCPSSP